MSRPGGALLALALALAAAAALAAVAATRSLAPVRAQAALPAVQPLALPTLAPPAVPAADLVRVTVRRPPTREELLLEERRRLEEGIAWRASRPLGSPSAGRLDAGVLLPPEGVSFFTWDPVRWASPSPEGRRYATDRLLRTILDVAEAFVATNPGAGRVAVGDLSRPGGGSFDSRFGLVGEFGRGPASRGHASHQNGLDADIYYPRLDRRERAPDALEDIDLRLAQDLVDRFVAAGAQFVFVGPRTGLTGPPGIVQPLVRHDDHLHVRLRPAP